MCERVKCGQILRMLSADMTGEMRMLKINQVLYTVVFDLTDCNIVRRY